MFASMTPLYMLNLYYPEIVMIQLLICLFPPFRIARIGLFLNSSVKDRAIFLLYLKHRFLIGYPTVQLILKDIYGLVVLFWLFICVRLRLCGRSFALIWLPVWIGSWVSQMMIFGELDGFTSGCSIRWPSFSMARLSSIHPFLSGVIIMVRFWVLVQLLYHHQRQLNFLWRVSTWLALPQGYCVL